MTSSEWVNLILDFAPGIFAALFYGIVSGSMSFMNKTVLTGYSYHYPDIVMLSQIVATSIALEVCRRINMCDIQPWTLKRGKDFAIPSFCFALHTTLALAALDDLSIPIYNVLRRMLPLASLIMSVIVLQKYPSRGTVASVSLIVTGTLFAGIGDLSFQVIGYSNAILSVLAQSVYLTFVQKTGLEKGGSALSVLHLNSINCIPMLLLFTALNGHLVKGFQFPGFSQIGFLVYFTLNIFLGCILNYSLFLCATKNSALTTSFVGVIKGVITTIIGFFTFGGVHFTFLAVGGVTLNAIGGVLYTYVKYKEKKNQIHLLLNTPLRSPLRRSNSKTSETANGMITRHRLDSGCDTDESIKPNGHVTIDFSR
ncbi:uncharacterized protein LOC130640731 [Hydractinia symbiolongicarpus]|uniref:uncharacterized protein LOC130640731 n=1 Tax=Hydractinia symbiolongicarpus TaxID=13093 RepID=UPI00254F8ACF|nr:uncharacterized protein LOC130640731 [Hydractinia symbiolongicarpus]